MQRAISGLCVAWNPLIAPQAIVMNRQGNIGPAAGLMLLRPSVSSGSCGHFIISTTRSATAMKSMAIANSGYIFPIILSMGSIVARK